MTPYVDISIIIFKARKSHCCVFFRSLIFNGEACFPIKQQFAKQSRDKIKVHEKLPLNNKYKLTLSPLKKCCKDEV